MWTSAQENLVFWLRHYDGFYERVFQQHYITDVERVKPWMVVYDVIVDAFFEWYSYNEKKDRNKAQREPGEANPPKASDHQMVYRGRM